MNGRSSGWNISGNKEAEINQWHRNHERHGSHSWDLTAISFTKASINFQTISRRHFRHHGVKSLEQQLVHNREEFFLLRHLVSCIQKKKPLNYNDKLFVSKDCLEKRQLLYTPYRLHVYSQQYLKFPFIIVTKLRQSPYPPNPQSPVIDSFLLLLSSDSFLSLRTDIVHFLAPK